MNPGLIPSPLSVGKDMTPHRRCATAYSGDGGEASGSDTTTMLRPMSDSIIWEYATVDLPTDTAKPMLDQRGLDGWELVSVLSSVNDRHRAYLKRPRSSAPGGPVQTGSKKASARLAELGIEIPADVPRLARYVPALRTGNLVYTSGQLPVVAGKLLRTGKVGGVVSLEDAKSLARTCVVNTLAAVDALVGIDSVTRVVKVVGFVSSADGFNDQPEVLNSASELLESVFGDAGAHARSSLGVSELPFDAPVEVELIVEVL